MNEPDPCGCHETQAEHDAVVQETLIAETMETGSMEFGYIHHRHDPEVACLLLGFLIGFVLVMIHFARREKFTIITLSHLRPATRVRRFNVQKMIHPIPLRILECETRCAYCHGSIQPSQMLNCPGCQTLHHTDCFIENGCSTFGCCQLQPCLVTIES